MLEFVRGVPLSRGADWLVVDVHGIGFRVQTTTATIAALAGERDQVLLWTHLYVREDIRALYGFASEDERALFAHLLSVSGVGPRMAVAALSMLSPPKLAAAIEAGDEAALARIPGVGKRMAQRMTLDLKGKLAAWMDGTPTRTSEADGVVVDALMDWGQLTRAEASAIVASLPADPSRAEEATLQLALKALASRRTRA